MKITLKERETGGFVIARDNEKRAGAMTFSLYNLEQDLIIINHTEVESQYKGQNVGMQMLQEIVDLARNSNRKILLECPFAAAMSKRVTNIQDVLK